MKSFIAIFMLLQISTVQLLLFDRKGLQWKGPDVTRKSTRMISEQWIEQKLDNFDPQNNQTFQMRYFENDEHYQTGGPIFVYVGGEWEISANSALGGLLYDMAVERNGYIFATEHRFYGQSIPNIARTPSNLKYLSIEQALADLAHFLAKIRANNAQLRNAKVVLIGCSYAGTMVSWFRLKYPHLITGSWSTSAPLLAEYNFDDYKIIVGQGLKYLGSQQCYDRVQEGFIQMEDLMRTKQSALLHSKLNCPAISIEIETESDAHSIHEYIFENFAYLVQYQRNDDITTACEILLSTVDPVEGLGKFINALDTQCHDPEMPSEAFEFDVGTCWYYQTCTEFGWYPTSSAENNQPFSQNFPVSFYQDYCMSMFGNGFDKTLTTFGIDRTNIMNGGRNLVAPNVLSTHGQFDPYRPAGLQESNHELSPVIITTNASHCADFNSISPNDEPYIAETKQQIKRIIYEWLQE